MPVSWKDLILAFEFVGASNSGEHQAFLCKQTSKLYWHSDLSDELDELPDDIDDEEKYVQIPDKRELDLGRPLVFDFVGQFLPDDFDDVQRIFSRKGAYARFKDLLVRRGALDNGTVLNRKRRKARCGGGAILIHSRSAMKTKASTGEERDDALAPLRLAVERASSEAQYAERRYMAVDPDNRLIARTLEADWEKALRKLETAKAELALCEQQRSQALREGDQS
jgi:hypothetical protein